MKPASFRSSGSGAARFFDAFVFGLLVCRSLAVQPISDEALARIDFSQKLHAQLPLDLQFVDENGQSVRLGNYFGTRPVILVLGYYGCPMLCTLELNGLVESLQDMKWRIGDQFTVLNVSINPEESPTLAAAKKQTYLKRYGRAGASEGWHFLTGRERNISRLAAAVGFEYRFDPVSRQYAHPSGLVVLTPQGKVSRYLFGVSYHSVKIYEALQQAAANEVGSPIQRIILLCFHYNPVHGKYGPTVLLVIRLLSVATMLAIVGLVVRCSRHSAAT